MTAMVERSSLAVVLAAGEGTRMKSAVPKVLHRIGGRPLIAHVLDSAVAAGVRDLAVVVGPNRDDVAAAARDVAPGARIVVQHERRGTAHAVLAARVALEAGAEDVLILYGDVPLVRPETLTGMRRTLAAGADVVVLGFEADDPTGYGRLLMDGEQLLAIREQRDASPQERAVRLCNSGIMALAGRTALALLDAVDTNNAQGEFYLTDVVEIAVRRGARCAVVRTDADEVMGVNDRAQLAAAEGQLQKRLRAAAHAGGVTLVAPETVVLAADTQFGRDVLVEPFCVFGPGVVVEDEAVIHAFSHLEGARVGRKASVGPFGRLRPGAQLGPGARIGNFVEIKSATVGAGAKVNHLSYVGDASVGAGANIGAGVITCNYDGFVKSRTEIGANAFIGSNSALVAPVTIGAGAYVASGSVITESVPADALALGRARQTVKEAWAARFRALRQRKD